MKLCIFPTTFADIETTARTIFGEASNEPKEGQLAVACVVWNRVGRQGWMGKTPVGVCLMRRGRYGQFSCWNEDDPNRARVQKVTLGKLRDLGLFDAVLEGQRLAGTDADPTRGACHYLNPSILPRLPRWARGREADVVIGAHHFYVGID